MWAPDISPRAANEWWRTNEVGGAILNKLMIVLVLAPVAFVLQGWMILSFVAFLCLAPYGFLVRRLAVRAVARELALHPERREEFEAAGILGTSG